MSDEDTIPGERIDEWGGYSNYSELGGMAIDELQTIIDHHESMGRMGEASREQAIALLQQLDELLRDVVKGN